MRVHSLVLKGMSCSSLLLYGCTSNTTTRATEDSSNGGNDGRTSASAGGTISSIGSGNGGTNGSNASNNSRGGSSSGTSSVTTTLASGGSSNSTTATGAGGATSSNASKGGSSNGDTSPNNGGSNNAGSTTDSSTRGGSSASATSSGGASVGGSHASGATSSATDRGGSSSAGGASSGGANQSGATNMGGSVSGGTSSVGGSATIGGSTNGGTSASSPNPDCTDTSTFSATFTKQYDGAFISVTNGTKTYRATTNWWHKFTDQTVTVDQIGFTVGNKSNVSSSASDGNPIGYPAIFIGTYSGNASTGSNLPKPVSSLTTVPTIFNTNSLSLDTSNFNAAYDVWFTATNAVISPLQSSPGKGGAYMMVWLFKPAERQPRGAVKAPAHTISGVEGTWDVWVDGAPTDPLCISYVSTTPLDSLSFDLNNFIKDSVTNGYGLTNNMYLSVIFAGFEIWGGGDGLELKQFCADVK